MEFQVSEYDDNESGDSDSDYVMVRSVLTEMQTTTTPMLTISTKIQIVSMNQHTKIKI